MNTFPPPSDVLDGFGGHLLVVPGIGVVVGLDEVDCGRDAEPASDRFWPRSGLRPDGGPG
jgi:hypothetical protein